VPEGVVIRALSGFYDVADGDTVRRCRARGVFRKRGITVLVGDNVQFDPIGLHEGVVTDVLPRRTELVRPPIANVDLALLVFSLKSPTFHTHLLDRAIVSVLSARIEPVVVVSKCDLGDAAEVEDAARPYRAAGYRVIPVSVNTGAGVAAIREAIQGHISVFVGPSGAGKSSLGNALNPELGLRMGEVSAKLGRGRHTTRHVELFQLAPDTYVADAPGFSQLEVCVPAAELKNYFVDFRAAAERCAYRGCLHMEEVDCGVRAAVESGTIANSRYESYRSLYEELRYKEENRY
jgi:ribosome biogenesis GTPase / thiamine phosphate phosphatase